MTDTTAQNLTALRPEFARWDVYPAPPPPDALVWWDTNAMADEIVRQRQRADRAERILAALREPSDEVVDAAMDAFVDWTDIRHGIRAAIAAAEREVDA